MGVLTRPVEGGALLDTELPQAVAKDRSGVLRPAIAVENELRANIAATDGRVEHRPRQVGAAPAGQGPRQDAARVLIHHDRQEPPAARDRDVRDVPHPHAIRPSHDKPTDTVGMLAEETVEPGIGAVDARRAGPEPRLLHQAHHASSAGRDAFGPERPEEARAPVGAAVRVEEAFNVAKELPVLLRVCTRATSGPRVVSGAGDVAELK